MPLIRTSGESTQTLQLRQYRSEAELQAVIETHPELLAADDEPRVAVVAREFVLPSGAGQLDLLLVDETGRPIAVEVKLERNGQSRREVFAQVFDYVSALAEYQVTALDQNTDRGIDRALRTLVGESNDVGVESAWLNCDRTLREGAPRVVIAVDSAPDDLVRIVRYANDHSDLDIRLVEIHKYASSNEHIFVPRLIVQGNEFKRDERVPRSTAPDLLKAVELFSPLPGVTVHGRARHYRAVRVGGWPASMHYEFLVSGGRVQPELHLESKAVMHLAPVIEGLIDAVEAALPMCEIKWTSPWQRVGGRLRVSRPDGFSPEGAVSAMAKLIEITRAPVAKALLAQRDDSLS